MPLANPVPLTEPIPLTRYGISSRLGQLYRHGRILRRLLNLLDDAERQGLRLTTADQLLLPATSRAEVAHAG